MTGTQIIPREPEADPGMMTVDARPKTEILKVSPSEYHQDPCETPSLSASIAIKLVQECPIKAWEAHPRLGNVKSKPNRAMQFGTVCHHRFSGVHTEIVVIDAKDYKTKAAQRQRDEALAAGKTPILKGEQSNADATADAAIKACRDAGLGLSGQWEQAVAWDDDGIQCRAMMDHIDLEAPYILDLKTCTNANPSILGRKIVDEGYDIQAAAYISAIESICPDLTGKIPFYFVFVETTGKHLASIVQPDQFMLDCGSLRWQRAKKIWKKCMAEDRWPGWPIGPTLVAPTPYQMQEAEMYRTLE